MNKVLLEITDCNDCPRFDNGYYSAREVCMELDRVIKGKRDERNTYTYTFYPIPDDCPLLNKP